MLLLALALAQVLDVSAGQLPAPPAVFPFTSNAGIDIGCVSGDTRGSRFDSQFVDRVHGETVLYNMSRCTGGFVRGTQDATGRYWRLEVSPTGAISGRDLAGRKWRFDRASGRYVVAADGASCVKADYRTMCGDPPG